MIIVTGATGKLGALIVQELANRMPASEIGVSVREPKKAAKLQEQGIRVRQGDFDHPDTLDDAFKGASQVLLVSSNAAFFGGDPVAQHRNAISAAKAAGARRILYTSHMGASKTSAFPPMWTHAETEDLLEHCGLAWTSLRNGYYADSIFQFLGPNWKDGQLFAPADGKVAWTTHGDLAAAAAAIAIDDRTFEGPTPPLTGPEALDMADIASLATKLLNKPIQRTLLTEHAFREGAKMMQLPDPVIDMFVGYYKASQDGEFNKVDPTLQSLIGRPPVGMRTVLADAIANSPKQTW